VFLNSGAQASGSGPLRSSFARSALRAYQPFEYLLRPSEPWAIHRHRRPPRPVRGLEADEARDKALVREMTFSFSVSGLFGAKAFEGRCYMSVIVSVGLLRLVCRLRWSVLRIRLSAPIRDFCFSE